MKPEAVALIDTELEFGEDGQYIKKSIDDWEREERKDWQEIVSQARQEEKEIRLYMPTSKQPGLGKVRQIVTHTPPGHIQPGHTHEDEREILMVFQGELAIHSPIEEQPEPDDRPFEDVKTIGPGESWEAPMEVFHAVSNEAEEYVITQAIQTNTQEGKRKPILKEE